LPASLPPQKDKKDTNSGKAEDDNKKDEKKSIGGK